jgi:hypothetical protein
MEIAILTEDLDLPNALNLKKNWGTALRNVVTAE